MELWIERTRHRDAIGLQSGVRALCFSATEELASEALWNCLGISCHGKADGSRRGHVHPWRCLRNPGGNPSPDHSTPSPPLGGRRGCSMSPICPDWKRVCIICRLRAALPCPGSDPPCHPWRFCRKKCGANPCEPSLRASVGSPDRRRPGFPKFCILATIMARSLRRRQAAGLDWSTCWSLD